VSPVAGDGAPDLPWGVITVIVAALSVLAVVGGVALALSQRPGAPPAGGAPAGPPPAARATATPAPTTPEPAPTTARSVPGTARPARPAPVTARPAPTTTPPSARPMTTAPAPRPATPTASASPRADPERAALAELQRHRRAALGRITPSGQWVAQLSSKYPGVRDEYQTTAGGSHVFRAADIAAQYHRLARDPRGHDVLVLLSTDFGSRQKIDGHALWVVFDDGDFAGADAVTTFCHDLFPRYSGDQLEDYCSPRLLNP
jgi:hypothetical protein